MRFLLIFFFILFQVIPANAQNLRKICVRYDIEIGCMNWGNDLQFYDFHVSTNPDDYKVKQSQFQSELQINGSPKAGDSVLDHNGSAARQYGEGIAYGFAAFFEQFQRLTYDSEMIKNNFAAIHGRVDEINTADRTETARASNSIPELKHTLDQKRAELDQKIQNKTKYHSALDQGLRDICKEINCNKGSPNEELTGDFRTRDNLLSQKRDQLLLHEGKLPQRAINNIYTTSGILQENARKAYDNNDFDSADAGQSLALNLVNFGLDLVPVVSDAKSLYEAVMGENPLTGEKLSASERAISAVSGTIGLLSVGSLGAVTKTALLNGRVLKYLPDASKAFQRAGSVVTKMTEIGIRRVTGAKQFLSSRMGKTWTKAMATGEVTAEYGIQKLDLASPINNPLPDNKLFARVMRKDKVEALKSGRGEFAGNVLDSNGNLANEVFITSVDDLKGLEDSESIAKKLHLITETGSTELRDLGSNYVVIEFKFKDSFQGLRSPIEIDGGRGFGFLPGGRTAGGAREWLIDNDAAMKGIIDLDSITMREIK